MHHLFLLFIPLALLFVNCAVSTEALQNQEELRMEIAKSITVPFSNVDTLVYNPLNGFCGMISKRELNRQYNPAFNEEHYSEVLDKQFDGTIIYFDMRDKEKIADLCGEIPLSKCMTKDKIRLKIHGRTLSRTSVKINEVYTLNDESHVIEKKFTLKNNQWSYEIINDSKM